MWKNLRLLVAALITQPSLATAGQLSHSISKTEHDDASGLLLRRESQQEMLVPASGEVSPLREGTVQNVPMQKQKRAFARTMASSQAALEAVAHKLTTVETPVVAAPAPAPAPAAPAEDDPAKHRISKANLLLLLFLSCLAGLVVVYRQASALFHPRQQEMRKEVSRSLGRNRGSTTKRWSQVINSAKPDTGVQEPRASMDRSSLPAQASSSSSPRPAANAGSQDTAKSAGVEEDEEDENQDTKSARGRSASVHSEVQGPDVAAGGPQLLEQHAPPVFKG